MSENVLQRLENIEETQVDHHSRIQLLESLMLRVLRAQERTEQSLKELSQAQSQTQQELNRLSREMLEFKEEMKEFKEDIRRSIKELNKKWGELANKMGTLAEDIIAPGLPYALKRAFGLEVEEISVRHRKRLSTGEEQEFDVIAVANGRVFLVDVKSKYRPQYLEEFENLIEKFLKFFPEYEGKKVVGVISAFNLSKEIVQAATKRNWLALQMGGEYLEFLNAKEVKL